ncbi:MAG: DUF998 domain-containing protein [archaeon]|nr:DUF998 domain-containing protein [archaeon]
MQNPKLAKDSGNFEANVKNSYLRLGSSLLVSGAIIFFFFNTIAEGLYPNYSVKTNALSDLGALGAPTRFLWDGQLFVSGVLILIGVYLLFYKSTWATNIKRKNIVSVIYLLPAVGTILVSLFPENFIPAIHTVSAFITFVLGGISALYAYRLTKSPFRYFSLILGIISLAAIPFLEANRSLDFGLVERLVVYPFVIWTLAFGTYLMARSS